MEARSVTRRRALRMGGFLARRVVGCAGHAPRYSSRRLLLGSRTADLLLRDRRAGQAALTSCTSDVTASSSRSGAHHAGRHTLSWSKRARGCSTACDFLAIRSRVVRETAICQPTTCQPSQLIRSRVLSAAAAPAVAAALSPTALDLDRLIVECSAHRTGCVRVSWPAVRYGHRHHRV